MQQVADWIMAAIRFYELLHLGYGHHASSLSHTTIENYQKSFIAVQIMYFVTSVLVKISILLLYRRIFGVSQNFTRAVYATLSLVVAYFVVCVCLTFFGCHPVSYFWDKTQEGECFDEVEFFKWNGVTNLLLDVIALALPLPMVWNLQLRTKQKLVLSGIFLLGFLYVFPSHIGRSATR